MGEGHAEAIEQTIRRYFEAFAARTDRSPYCAGPLRRLQECAVATSNRVDRWDTVVDIRELTVEAVDGKEATVSLVGVFRGTAGNAGVDRKFSRDISGPVRLVHEDGAWRVADYRTDGASIRDSITAHDEEWQGANGIRTKPVVSLHRRKQIEVFFYLESDGPRLWGWECFTHTRLAGVLPGVLFKELDVGPHEPTLAGASFRVPKFAGPRVKVVVPLFDRSTRHWNYAELSIGRSAL